MIVKIALSTPFILGFFLDIYWNVFHFSFKLKKMNKTSRVKNKPFWPPFSKVEGFKTLYRITLTERLQKILDEYPDDSRAYHYALIKAELLNKYDPKHLIVTRRKL